MGGKEYSKSNKATSKGPFSNSWQEGHGNRLKSPLWLRKQKEIIEISDWFINENLRAKTPEFSQINAELFRYFLFLSENNEVLNEAQRLVENHRSNRT